MATWEQVAARVEQVAPLVLAELAARQEAYRGQHGVYWQGVWTSAASPRDGAELYMDMAVKPHDQAESWAAFGMTRRRLPVRVAVDVYTGGYVLRVAIIWAGVERVRAWSVGADPSLSHDWLDCPETF